MLLLKRFLRLVTLAAEIALWLAVALSFLLLNTGIQYGKYNNFFQDYLTYRAVSDGCTRFMALSFATMFLSILVRLCFPNRREVIPAAIRFGLYVLIIGFVGSCTTMSSSHCRVAEPHERLLIHGSQISSCFESQGITTTSAPGTACSI